MTHDHQAPPLGTSTIPRALATAASRFGDAPWLAYDGQVQSFTELAQRVDAIAAGLIAAGVRPGDGVASFLGNGFEWLQLEYAVAACGAWLVPLNTWLRTRELTHILASSGCRALFWGSTVLGQDTRPLLDELVPELRHERPGGWSSSRFPDLRLVCGLGGQEDWQPGVTHWSALLREGEGVAQAQLRERADAVSPQDVGLVLYTSGTTGVPKGAMLSHTGIVDHMREWTRHIGLGPDDRSLMASPLFWVFGCTMNAMVPLHAGSMTILHDRFDARRFLTDFEAYGGTHLQGVPEQYELALGHPDAARRDLSTIRLVQIGGSRSASTMALRILDRAPEARMISAYGLTEAVGVNTWTDIDDPIEALASTIGHAAPDNEVVIRDAETFDELAPGETGELWIRGAHVARGYLGDETATAETFVDGWLRTGDLGKVDDRGYFTIAGRRAHTYKRGSMNVYPAEAEALLEEHPAIERAALIGVPDPRLGEVGAAYVVVVAGEALDEARLMGWCEGKLAAYKLPSHIRFVDALPVTASGKVKKFELQDSWRRQESRDQG